MNRIKLSQFAKNNGISYMTAYRMFHNGEISGIQLKSKTILIDVIDNKPDDKELVAIYCRVSSSQNKSNLQYQKDRVYSYCVAKGYTVDKIICEIGSGINDNRKQWISLLENTSITKIVVEHKDRFTRFGFNAIETLLKKQNRTIEVINNSVDAENDLIQDFISIITSFCSRIYGNRRSKRNTEKIIKGLMEDDKKIKI